MFVTLYKCVVLPGKVNALRELYGEWQRFLSNMDGVITEFLASSEDPADVVLLARFPDETAAWSVVDTAHYRAWYAQLARLTEAGPIVCQYHRSL